MTHVLGRVHRGIGAIVLTLALAAPAFAQQPAALPKPDAKLWTNGAVDAVARGPNGEIVIGGAFDRVLGVERRNIARFNANGTLDMTWNPGVNSTVNTLAIDAAGDVYVGGFFSSAGGANRSNIAKLSGGTGAADATWNPGASHQVEVLVLDGNGSLYAAGTFSSIGGAFRNRVAKLSTTGAGSANGMWDPNVGGGFVRVTALAYDATNDALFLGGDFSTVGVSSRANVAKVAGSGTGAVDATWNPGSNGTVLALALDGGQLYAGGFFSMFAGATNGEIARVDATSGADDATFTTSFNDGVSALDVDGSHVYVGGAFSMVNGADTSHAVRLLKSDGSSDPAFAPQVNTSINVLETFGDGSVYIASSQLAVVNDEVRLGVAKLDTNGVLQSPMDTMVPGTAYALAPLADGSTLVGGSFYYADDVVHANLLKLTPAGEVDPTWTPRTNGIVFGLALDAAGANVYVNGTFARAGGAARFNAAKFATAGAGALDAAWNPAADGMVNAIAVRADGDVYVGGRFMQIGGGFRNNLAKVSGTTGAIDAAWGPGGTNDQGVGEIIVAPNGSVFVSGFFTTINGSAKTGFAKIDPTTGVTDPAWTANLGMFEIVRQVAFDGDAMYVAGNYATVNGSARTGLAKLTVSSPTTLDPDWTPTLNSAEVESIARAPDGALLIGGGFTLVDGQPRARLAKLATDATATLDTEWTPELSTSVGGIIFGSLAVDASGDVLVAGMYGLLSGSVRQGIGALPPTVIKPDPVFADGFE